MSSSSNLETASADAGAFPVGGFEAGEMLDCSVDFGEGKKQSLAYRTFLMMFCAHCMIVLTRSGEFLLKFYFGLKFLRKELESCVGAFKNPTIASERDLSLNRHQKTSPSHFFF
jgi:hypothetical protein